MPTPDAPELLTPGTEATSAATQVDAVAVAPASQATSAAEEGKEESFKELVRDFVLGNTQNPDDMPGLRFYIVFAGMLALALVGVGIVATLLGLLHWIRALFH
jgi:hypothetical protein